MHPGIQRYEIQRDGVNTGNVPGNATSFVDSTVSASTTYTYAVRAIDGANNASAFSNTATATTPRGADTRHQPSGGKVPATATSSQSIVVTWQAATDAGGSGLAGYQIFRDGGANPVATVAAGVLTFTDTGRQPNTAYSYVVRAFDGDGNVSAASNAASATTPPGFDSTLSADQRRRDRAEFDFSAHQLEYVDRHWGVRVSGLSHLSQRRAAQRSCSQRRRLYGRDRRAQYGLRLSGLGDRQRDQRVRTVGGSQRHDAGGYDGAFNSGRAHGDGRNRNAGGPELERLTDTGGSGLAGYRVLRNGTQIGTPTPHPSATQR